MLSGRRVRAAAAASEKSVRRVHAHVVALTSSGPPSPPATPLAPPPQPPRAPPRGGEEGPLSPPLPRQLPWRRRGRRGETPVSLRRRSGRWVEVPGEARGDEAEGVRGVVDPEHRVRLTWENVRQTNLWPHSYIRSEKNNQIKIR